MGGWASRGTSRRVPPCKRPPAHKKDPAGWKWPRNELAAALGAGRCVQPGWQACKQRLGERTEVEGGRVGVGEGIVHLQADCAHEEPVCAQHAAAGVH